MTEGAGLLGVRSKPALTLGLHKNEGRPGFGGKPGPALPSGAA